ncbi:MAG: glycosyltransferase family 39 protein [Gammaproteobacteria bacterium]|nr:glycosyltransferase family 39 protein [Gammaproteobacteria bacterium]
MNKLSSKLTSNTAVLSLLFLWLSITAYFRPLLLPDEGRYAGVVLEMLQQGNWLTPTLNGMPFFHKPPLLYWIDMVVMSIFGVNELTARSASILGAWLCGATVFIMLRRWQGVQAGLAAVMVLATCPLFYLAAQFDNHDMLVAGLISMAILCFARFTEEGAAARRYWLWSAYALCALAVLTKGLIGVVIPAMVIGPWLLYQRRWSSLRKLFDLPAIGIFLVICLPWFVLMQWRYADFFHYFFIRQQWQRYSETLFNNTQPVWFFLAVLPLLTLPWSIVAPAALRRAWRERSPLQLLFLWWLMATLLFFSLMKSKLVGYILPAVTPWAILIALWVCQRPYRLRLSAVAAVLCVAMALWAARNVPEGHRVVATMLQQQMTPHSKVVFIGDYFYDIPFYARLHQPIIVLEDWQSPEVEIVDNWRQELKHAANFDPQRGADRLIETQHIDSLACMKTDLWFVVQQGMAVTHPELFALHKLYAKDDVELYLSKSTERACAGGQGAPSSAILGNSVISHPRPARRYGSAPPARS